MKYFVKVLILSLLFQNEVTSKAIHDRGFNIKKNFNLEFLPFKHFSLMVENFTPFGNFEVKHSLEKRDTIAETVIANEIPVGDKKEPIPAQNAIVVPPVEVPLAPAPAPIVPLVIEITAPAPKPVEAPLVPAFQEKPVIVNNVAPPVPVSNVPVFYTDISQIPLYSFAYSQPESIAEVNINPKPLVPEIPIKPVPALPEIPVTPIHIVSQIPINPPPVVPANPIPVVSEAQVKPIATIDDIASVPESVPVPIQPVPIQPVPIQPVPIQPVPVKEAPVNLVQQVAIVPEVPLLTSPPPLPEPPKVETPVAPPPPLPPIPNYFIKGSRLIVFYGTKLLQMLSQFVESGGFNQLLLPPPPQLMALGNKK